MNPILILCVVLITIAVVIAVIFLIQTLVQARRTANEAEVLLKSLNHEIEEVKHVTDKVSSFVGTFDSPWFKAVAGLAGVASVLLRRFKKKQPQKTQNGT